MFRAALISFFRHLRVDSVNSCWLTMHAHGRRDSHRQNDLVLALSISVSQTNPVPPAAGNADRWAARLIVEVY